MMTSDEFRRLVSDLAEGTWALAVLSFAFETELAAHLAQPRSAADLEVRAHLPRALVDRVLDVLAAVGAVTHKDGLWAATPGMRAFTAPPLEGLMEAEIKNELYQALQLATTAEIADGRGWRHTDPRVLRAHGKATAGVAASIANRLILETPGLAERLRGARAAFLDVGTGVGELAIQMANLWPSLHVVGVDPLRPAIDEARRSIELARLEQRIELRRQAIEDLPDEERFDLAWIPQPFLSVEALEKGLPRVLRALRPDGWAFVPVLAGGGASMRDALGRLKTFLWGGAPLEPREVEAMLSTAGFADVRIAPTSTCPVVLGHR